MVSRRPRTVFTFLIPYFLLTGNAFIFPVFFFFFTLTGDEVSQL